MSESCIPKIIHYCWFGGKPLSELAKKCIESWKKYCPDYKIIRWDESNFDLDYNTYVREAYEAKMWAFVSDYVRFKILYDYGGIYFDTDVELIESIDDIIKMGTFMCLEQHKQIAIATGLGIAVPPRFSIIKEILDDYHNSHFIRNEQGMYETVVMRVTRIILKYGNVSPSEISKVNGITIYPPEYFCPFDYYTGKTKITDNTRAIHHYDGSWLTDERKQTNHLKYKLVKFLPERMAGKISTAIVILQSQGICQLIRQFIKNWRKNVKKSI